MKTIAKKLRPQFSIKFHAIGDSANTVLLKIYKDALAGKKRPSMENRTRKWFVKLILIILS
jgi:predicted amidohydrolase YtcJ